MKLLTAAQMRAVDEQAMTSIGIPGMVLMENAGHRAAQVALNLLQELGGRKAGILAGKGNNGGDGFVVARYLYNRGYKVKIFLVASPGELRGDAATNFRICQQLGVDIVEVDERYLSKLRLSLSLCDLLVDALLGTGITGAPRGLMAPVIETVNTVRKPVLAIDVPSGLNADTGEVAGPCVQATATVTMAAPKVGLFLYPGASRVGRLFVADIGIPRQLLEKAGSGKLLSGEEAMKLLPARPPDGHKGTFGHVLIVAGSVGMTGAAALAGRAALRSGAGLVSIAVPASLNDIMETKVTEAMTIPLPETDGRALSLEAFSPLCEHMERASALVVGPGLSRNPSTGRLVAAILAEASCPVVLDADGLNLVAGTDHLRQRTATSCDLIITPHPGEMARLLGCSTAEVQARRIESACQAASLFQCVVILKGANSVIAAPDGRFWINPTGNSGMATGGSGDVLSGVLGAWLAQRLKPLAAARLAVYLHGLAGDIAVRQRGEVALVAGDLVESLPEALKTVLMGKIKDRWVCVA